MQKIKIISRDAEKLKIEPKWYTLEYGKILECDDNIANFLIERKLAEGVEDADKNRSEG